MININNEKELHYKVVDYIRNFIKEAIIIPGLGEHQINSSVRTDAYLKGYTGGQVDIILLNYHTHYKGLAIELKTPTGLGIISDKQQNYINSLENNGFKTLISSNYDEIITTIIKYSMGIALPHNRDIQEMDKENMRKHNREHKEINKERLKENMQKYYIEHKETLKEYFRNYSSKKTLCDCGIEYQRGNKHHHLNSLHHKKWLGENLL